MFNHFPITISKQNNKQTNKQKLKPKPIIIMLKTILDVQEAFIMLTKMIFEKQQNKTSETKVEEHVNIEQPEVVQSGCKC